MKILVDVNFLGQDLTGTSYFDVTYVSVQWLSVRAIARAVSNNETYNDKIYGASFFDACERAGIDILRTEKGGI